MRRPRKETGVENIVYAADYRPYCHQVKKLLQDHGIRYQTTAGPLPFPPNRLLTPGKQEGIFVRDEKK
jgi:hypothetical protein